MKKVLALVICIAMIACFAVTASAASPLALSASTVEAEKGEVVAIDIKISEKTNVGALEVLVKIDEAILKAVTTKDDRDNDVYFIAGASAIDAGALVEGSNGVEDQEDGSRAFSLATATSKGYWKADTIWTLYFEVIGDLPAEGTPIDVVFVSAADIDSVAIAEAEVTDGAVMPKAEEPPIVEPPIVEPPIVEPPIVEPPEETIDEPIEETIDEPIEEPEDPEDPEEPTDGEDGEDGEEEIPATGDASAIAVAAGLCAVMAAAFVLTKKVND